MSSTISSTEVQTIPKTPIKIMEEKQQRLVRTSSLEKIRRLNTYICTQHYYILPALLTWLKTSNINSTAEKTILIFRSLIFNNIFYKLYQVEIRLLTSAAIARVTKFSLPKATDIETTHLLRLTVYFAGFALVSQLGYCLYILSFTNIPSGLVFLIACWLYINFLHSRTLFFYAGQTKLVVKKLK